MATQAEILAALPVGRQNAVSVPKFEILLGNPPGGTNQDRTRAQVTRMMKEGFPIGSGPEGYWLLDSDAECQDILASINKVIASYTAKRDAIQTGWTKRKASKAAGKPWPK